MMTLSTAVWHILNNKPIPQELVSRVVEVLRDEPDYLKPILSAAKNDYKEVLTPKLEKYAEKYRKSPNQSSNNSPKFIVLHDSYGSFAGTVSWIANPTADVSYHYSINPEDGSRIQHVWDSRKAWHAGKSSWRGYYGLNSHSVGIAFMGNTYKRDVAEHEIDSAAKKCLYLMDKFRSMHNRRPNQVVITHEMIAPGRKTDTAPRTYTRVLNRIQELT